MYVEKKKKEMSESSWIFVNFREKKAKSTIVRSYNPIARISRATDRTQIEQNRMKPSFVVMVFGQTMKYLIN